MARVPPQTREELDPEQQKVHDTMVTMCNKAYGPNGENFTYQNQDGSMVGPFPTFIVHPRIAGGFLELSRGMIELPLPPDARETASITAAAHFGETYVQYSHKPQAVNPGYLSQEQADMLSKGNKPDDLNERCSVAFDIAKSLTTKQGPMPQEYWDRAIKALGRDGAIAILHYTGLYCYASVIMNGADVNIPE